MQERVDPWSSLSEVRSDDRGRYAVVANARRAKPEPSKEKKPDVCIFCPGSRGRLVAPYLQGDARKEMEDRGLYVLENKYSAVTPPEKVPTFHLGEERIGGMSTYYRHPIVGRHLVMIETPEHNIDPFADSQEGKRYYQNLVSGYLLMLRGLRAEGFAWGGLGKNRNGVAADGSTIHAGASQPHPHSQAVGLTGRKVGEEAYETVLFGLPFRWLRDVIKEHEMVDMDSMKKNFPIGDKHLKHCRECEDSHSSGYNLQIASNDRHASLVAPVPSRNPHHVQIKLLPFSHQHLFDEMTCDDEKSFASVLHETMVRLNRAYPNCGYNFELRQSAWGLGEFERKTYDSRAFHWEFDIYPAWPELDTIRQDGFMSHLLEAAVLTESPESIAEKLNPAIAERRRAEREETEKRRSEMSEEDRQEIERLIEEAKRNEEDRK